ncbi:MAG: hypothetical protein QW055_06265 [Candidatus Nezhaarchaeales archaeon]
MSSLNDPSGSTLVIERMIQVMRNKGYEGDVIIDVRRLLPRPRRSLLGSEQEVKC